MKQHKNGAETRRKLILAGIQAYSDFDKSDPFCYARMMTHFRTGLCKPSDKGEDGHYSATKVPGAEGSVTWINLKRV